MKDSVHFLLRKADSGAPMVRHHEIYPFLLAERGSFVIDCVDDQCASSDQACRRDAALERMLDQAGADSLADPILIGRELSQ
ncbi:hypothetical protein A5906_10140 [Bradyrhizobium sacchari]|nr:hypothetical protein A5906_10140 [Bradyrhizobium sacchari]